MSLRHRPPVVAALAAAATLCFALTACANPVEQFIEDQTGVSIDTDGDGEITVESEDGSVSISSGADVPADFPGEVPLPSEGTVQSAVAMSGSWSLTYLGVADGAVEGLESALTSAGFEKTYDARMEDYAQSIWDDGTWTVSIVWDGSEEGILNYSVVPTP